MFRLLMGAALDASTATVTNAPIAVHDMPRAIAAIVNLPGAYVSADDLSNAFRLSLSVTDRKATETVYEGSAPSVQIRLVMFRNSPILHSRPSAPSTLLTLKFPVPSKDDGAACLAPEQVAAVLMEGEWFALGPKFLSIDNFAFRRGDSTVNLTVTGPGDRKCSARLEVVGVKP